MQRLYIRIHGVAQHIGTGMFVMPGMGEAFLRQHLDKVDT
jgi:hypothetical protein